MHHLRHKVHLTNVHLGSLIVACNLAYLTNWTGLLLHYKVKAQASCGWIINSHIHKLDLYQTCRPAGRIRPNTSFIHFFFNTYSHNATREIMASCRLIAVFPKLRLSLRVYLQVRELKRSTNNPKISWREMYTEGRQYNERWGSEYIGFFVLQGEKQVFFCATRQWNRNTMNTEPSILNLASVKNIKLSKN